MKRFLVLSFAALFQVSFCANILIISLLPSPSHHIWNEALAEGLVKNGHNVTLLGHDSPKFISENYTVLKIDGIYEAIHEIDLASFAHASELEVIRFLWDIYIWFCQLDIKSEALKTIRSYPSDTFDVILFDVNSGHCLYPLVEKFGNPPLIAISALGVVPFIGDMVGQHIFPYVPFYMLPYTDHMSFLQRLYSLFLQNAEIFIKKRIYEPKAFAIAQEHFGQNISSFGEVERRITLMISNTDFLLDYPQPMPPNVILTGGLHIKPAKVLPSDLQGILDGATNGVVYFSLGTNIQPGQLPRENKQGLMNAFAKLPYTILAKFDASDLEEVPKNVVVRKWFSQNDVLGHKNVKAFITHGGALSIQEALYHGVPLVGMPLFLDQKCNMMQVVHRKLGLVINFLSTEKEVSGALIEVLDNPTYRNNMRRLSKKFHDQPQTPLERAVFWVEYVLRNGNADHLSFAARDMYAYQTLHLDVLGFLILVTILLIFFVYSLIKFVLRLLTKKKTNPKLKRQ